MHCRTTPTVNFRNRLGLRQHDLIITQEQSALTKIMTVFVVKEKILQYNFLGYRVDANLPKNKLELEIDDQEHNDRDLLTMK